MKSEWINGIKSVNLSSQLVLVSFTYHIYSKSYSNLKSCTYFLGHPVYYTLYNRGVKCRNGVTDFELFGKYDFHIQMDTQEIQVLSVLTF